MWRTYYPLIQQCQGKWINPLNAELNPICHLLALLGAHHILHISRIRVKLKKLLLLKRYNCKMSLCTVSWQQQKLSLNKHFVFFCLLHAPVGVSHIRLLPLIFTGWFLLHMTPSAVSQSICTQFSTVSLFNLGNARMEHFAMLICDDCHVLGKKSKKECLKNEVPMTVYTPLHCMMKLATAIFHCDFPLFHGLESFCRHFHMSPRLYFLHHLTLRRLMSYIYIYIYMYGAPILDVSRSHTTTQHSR